MKFCPYISSKVLNLIETPKKYRDIHILGVISLSFFHWDFTCKTTRNVYKPSNHLVRLTNQVAELAHTPNTPS